MTGRDDDSLWLEWRMRWDRCQDRYVPHREQQFHLMLEMVEALVPRRPLRLIDLGAGAGSLAQRALERQPDTEVVCIDVDPWLMMLGQRTLPTGSRVRWHNADLRSPGWSHGLPSGAFDAVVTATATHWLEEEYLCRVYAELSELLPPDGLFMNADVMPAGSSDTLIARYGREQLFRWQSSSLHASGAESWVSFWHAARAEPLFVDLLVAREAALGTRPARRFLPAGAHAELLRAAGFREVVEVWRFHAAAILVAVN
jgi:ubiquinone/menaquinone biosynthesis C-methylase UbiE